MSCHGGRSNRLDDQLAAPGFPDIDDHVMGSLARVGRGDRRCPPLPSSPLRIRQPQLPGTSAGGGRCSIPGPAVEIMLLPLSTRAGPSLSSSGNDSTAAKAAPPIHGAGDRIPAPPAHPGAGGDAKQRGDRMSTEQPQSSFTDASPEPGPAGGRASTGLMFCLLPLSSAALGGLTVGGFFFVIAAAAFLSDRARYGAALSV